MLDLYARRWEGRPLGPDDYVISSDEKSQLQALRRRHRGQPPAPGRTRRVRVRVPPRWHPGLLRRLRRPSGPGTRPDRPQDRYRTLRDLVAHVMTTRTICLARRVFWVVDNGSSHNGARSIDRMQTTWPTATLVHLPIHAILAQPGRDLLLDPAAKSHQPQRLRRPRPTLPTLLGFQDRYNTTATPFDWTYTRDRPQRLPRPPRPPRHPARRMTPDELTTATTSCCDPRGC